MRLSIVLVLVTLAACGGDTFEPEPENLLGYWSLSARGDPGSVRCTQTLTLEVTPESITLGSGLPDSVVGRLSWSGWDGWRRCENDAGRIVVNEPYLLDALLLVALDGADVEIWRDNGQFLYRGRMTSGTRMQGELGPGNISGPGRWWAVHK